jgi:hypothetical protein
MPAWLLAALIGAVAGAAASWVMSLYQQATQKAFGQDGGGTPATEKAADTASAATIGHYVPGPKRPAAGSAVHYVTGIVLGVIYAVAALYWPPVTLAFGIAYGVAVMLVVDDLLVPLAGWGTWPTTVAVHLYSLTSHIVYGVVLEGVRRAGAALL